MQFLTQKAGGKRTSQRPVVVACVATDALDFLKIWTSIVALSYSNLSASQGFGSKIISCFMASNVMCV